MRKKQSPVPAPVDCRTSSPSFPSPGGGIPTASSLTGKGKLLSLNSAGTITGFQDSDRQRGLDSSLIQHEVWGRAPALLGNSEGREGTNAVVTTTSITPCARALR